MYCCIIDDQPHVVRHLSELVRETPGLELVSADTEPLVLLNSILTGVITPDIVFADIEMPGLPGTEFARQLPRNIVTIFVTAHASYALEAFDIGAADYLLKPINTDSFLRAVSRARERKKFEEPVTTRHKRVFIRLDSRNLIKVRLKDIRYIEADDKRIHLYVKAKEPIRVLRALNNIETALPGADFVRIHKSYIVNLKYVGGVVGRTVVMIGGETLSVGPTYSEALYRRFNII